jgi:AcrR family transcriptional regulator
VDRQAKNVRAGLDKKRPVRARLKPDARRKAIVAAAWTVFREEGFERASMSAIAVRAGGSKATLYAYFRSKEELFTAALEQVLLGLTDQAFARMGQVGEFRSRLLKFGNAYLETRLSPDLVKIDRALIGAAETSALGSQLRVRVIEPQLRRLAAILAQEIARGRLRKSDPYLAALHLRGLIEADLLERRLHGDALLADRDLREAVESGVDAFLRAYACPEMGGRRQRMS